MYDTAFRKAYATVAWYEQFRHGDFVFMRRGTGETGWWHAHQDEPRDDYGGNPSATTICRFDYWRLECFTLTILRAAKARASFLDACAIGLT